MKRDSAGLLFFACALAGGAALASAARPSQTNPATPKAHEQLIYSLKGPDLFRAHCAPCHGLDGKGGGPMAAALKTKPADLTVLAKNNGGKFPAERATKFISGNDVIAAHGTREMPVWGPIFHQVEEDQDFGNVRLQNVVKYLETIQQK